MPEKLTLRTAPDPLSAVRRRIDLYRQTRDLAVLSSAAADDDYAAAMAAAIRVGSAGEVECDLDAQAELARFRFWRGATSGSLTGRAEADAAVRLFLELSRTAPDLVPAEMAGLVGELAADPVDRLDWAMKSASTLSSLGNGEDTARLDQAVDLLVWALATVPPNTANRIRALSQLSQAHQERAQATGDVDESCRAVAIRREVVELSPRGKDRARRLSLLAESLLALHEKTGDESLLREAIEALEESISTTPSGDEFLWLRQQRLARAHRSVAENSGSMTGLNAAVRWSRLACDGVNHGSEDYIATLITLDRSLRARYRYSGDSADLDEAVSLWRTTLTALPQDDAQRVAFLVRLGSILHHRFEAKSDPADLEESVSVGIEALAAGTEDHPSRIDALSDLCYRLRCRFDRDGNLADLVEALRVGRLAVARTIPARDGEGGVTTLSNLLNADLSHFEKVGDLTSLDEAITLTRDILAATPAGHPERAARLATRATVVEKRFERTGERIDADQVLRAARDCLEVEHPDLGQTAETLLRFARRLDIRTEAVGRPAHVGRTLDNVRFEMRARSREALETVDRLVDLGRAVAARSEIGEQDPEIQQIALAVALAVRYRVTGSAVDSAESISVMRHVVANASPDDPRYSHYLTYLGDALTDRFVRGGDPADLDAAVAVSESALRSAGPTDTDRDAYLSRLTLALRLRYEDGERPEDLHRVITVVRDALARAHPAADCRPASLSELARVLMWRYYHSKDPVDLDQAVEAGRQAVDCAGYSAFSIRAALRIHASALFTRYLHAGSGADLDSAISKLESALAVAPGDNVPRTTLLHDHAVYVHVRALSTGSSADFDRSVAELREVTALTPAHDPMYALHFSSLGMALSRRYAHLGDGLDLDAAIEAHRAAVRLATQDPLQWAIAAVGLANTLTMLYERTGDRTTLDEAITLAAEAGQEFPEHGSVLSQPLSTLSSLLRIRVELPGEPDPRDIAELLNVSERMLASASSGSSEYGLFLRNRAVALVTVAQATGDGRLMNQAVSTVGLAVEATERGDSRRAEWLWSQGRIHEARHRALGDPADLDAALACWHKAARDPYGDPDMVARCAVRAARLEVERGETESAVADYSRAVRCLPTVAWHGMRTRVRGDNLRAWSGLGSEAAAAAVEAGKPTLAVELLEQSRSIIWTQALHLRSDLSELAASHPELSDRLTSLRVRLDAHASAGSPLPRLGPTSESSGQFPQEPGARRRELARQWDETIEQVRRIEGFEHFLGPTPYAELKGAASDGPVVIVNPGRSGGHALFIHHDLPEPQVLELPGATLRAVAESVVLWSAAMDAQTDASARFLTREAARHACLDVLEWLWDTFVQPILAALDLRADTARTPPRMWWYPVGALSMLPLHAAGRHPRHRTAAAADGEWTGAVAVSSYTPTLAALARSRAPLSVRATRRQFAVVLPQTPGHAALPAAAEELAALRRHAPDSAGVLDLSGPAATRDAVLAALPQCGRVHFACHAAQDSADPEASAFNLYDGPLTIADVAELNLADAELAYLSACQTAAGMPGLADEMIHLAAAVQLAGFRHLIATSWNVEDTAAASMSDHFYAELAAAGGAAQAGKALHRAVRTLRDHDPTEPARWASHVHFGS